MVHASFVTYDPEKKANYYKWAKESTQAVRDIADRSYRNAVKTIIAKIEAMSKREDPYKQWLTSGDMVDCLVKWNDGLDTRKLGFARLDMSMPVFVGREFINRYLSEELNKKKGAAWMFELQGDCFALDDEKVKKLDIVAPQKLNTETREVEHVIVLRENPDKDRTDVPLFDWDADKKTGDDAVSEDELWSDEEAALKVSEEGSKVAMQAKVRELKKEKKAKKALEEGGAEEVKVEEVPLGGEEAAAVPGEDYQAVEAAAEGQYAEQYAEGAEGQYAEGDWAAPAAEPAPAAG